VLRIEDTDVARSTQDSVDQILASMRWLGLDYDEGPVYQMQRLDRYAAVVDQLIAEGKAYRCYSTPEELDAVREAKKARGEKALYDGRWRPEPGKVLPPVPEGVKPVIRFKNPQDGDVTWNDLVKGPDHHQQPRDRRPHHRADRRYSHLQLRGGGGRLGHADQSRLPW
jgi:glutamyl-tRNA synthetase